jgi:hypothetical protein
MQLRLSLARSELGLPVPTRLQGTEPQLAAAGVHAVSVEAGGAARRSNAALAPFLAFYQLMLQVGVVPKDHARGDVAPVIDVWPILEADVKREERSALTMQLLSLLAPLGKVSPAAGWIQSRYPDVTGSLLSFILRRIVHCSTNKDKDIRCKRRLTKLP